MAHWLLRERMAEHQNEGHERQERIKREQHRPEQNQGYDEAARGGAGMPKSDVVTNPDSNRIGRDEREAANDVRRREHSAD
jgi:hypothetical protein